MLTVYQLLLIFCQSPVKVIKICALLIRFNACKPTFVIKLHCIVCLIRLGCGSILYPIESLPGEDNIYILVFVFVIIQLIYPCLPYPCNDELTL